MFDEAEAGNERGDAQERFNSDDESESYESDQGYQEERGGGMIEPEQVELELNLKDKTASSFGLVNEVDIASEDKNASLHMPRDGNYDAHPSYASRNSNEINGPAVDQKDTTLKEQPAQPSESFDEESFAQVQL